MIALRGHHLFCMTLFSGHGYDEHFTENMAAILAELTSDENAEILLVAQDDDICAACPNLNKGQCGLGNTDVKSRDHYARQALSIQCGETYFYRELLQNLANVTEPEFNRVCGNCTWWKQGFCSYELFQRNIEQSADTQ